MFIGIDKEFRIKQIAETAEEIVNPTLEVLEIDRQAVFGSWTDRRILAYCYKPLKHGYSIYPARDLTDVMIQDNEEATRKVDARVDDVNVTQSIAFVTLAEAGQIDDVTAGEHAELFEEWNYPIAYKVGQLRQHKGKLYKCISEHTSQEDWTPDTAVSLWVATSDPAEEYPEWSQPVGAHDAYNIGDKVAFNDKHWVSDVDGNVWRPDVYGWTEEKEA